MLPGCYEEEARNDRRQSLLFTIEDKPGALDSCLRVFREAGLNLKHIESRPSKSFAWDYDFTVELELQKKTNGLLDKTIKALESNGAKDVQLVGSGAVAIRTTDALHSVPWFPRKLTDLDSFATKTLEYGAELTADHPGFTDEAYRKRRAEITAIAKVYRTYPKTCLLLHTNLHMSL